MLSDDQLGQLITECAKDPIFNQLFAKILEMDKERKEKEKERKNHV